MSKTVKSNLNSVTDFNVFVTDEPNGTPSIISERLERADDVECFGWYKTKALSADSRQPVYRIYCRCTHYLTAEENLNYLCDVIKG